MPSSWGGFIVAKEKLLREKYPIIPYFQILQSKQTQKRNKHPSVDNFFICPPFVWSAVSEDSRKTKKQIPATPKKHPLPTKKRPAAQILPHKNIPECHISLRILIILGDFQMKTSRSTTSSTRPLILLRLRVTLEPAGKTKRGQKKNSKNPVKFVANS